MSTPLENSPRYNGTPSVFYNIAGKEKAPCYSILPSADQHRLAQQILDIGERSNAAGFKLQGRSYSDGKNPMELHLLAMGERASGEEISMPAFGPKGCPFHGQLTDGPKLVQSIVTLSGNTLLVSTACKPHMLQCTREEVVEFYLEAERLMAGGPSSSSDVVERWSGTTLSQVGETGGQKIPHAHLHVTRGIKV